MIALPSIAFGGFSGSAKGVTARQVGGRSILSVKCWPTGAATGAQLIRRASLKKISKSWKELTSDQMRDWDRLAETATGQSVFGQAAQLSGMNLYVRLNANRAMAGEPLMTNAPLHTVAVPAGISNGWSKTVIITPGMEDDWGEADVTRLYLKTIGVEPVPGEKVFVQAYWLDTSTGFAGIEARDTVVVTGESPYQRRVKATMDNLDPNEESHVSSLDVDFSTGAPVAEFNAMCLGHSNVASSEVYLDQQLPAELIGTGICLGRGNGADGKIIPQSYLVYIRNYGGKAEMTFAHRGGYYVKPTECFGSGIIY